MNRPLRILIALPGLHRVVRGAETALESVAIELGALGHSVTLIGSGQSIPGRPYEFIHAPCISREWFIHWPKVPYLRTNYDYEELTFAPGLYKRVDPRQYDVTMTCGYPYTNWCLRRRRDGHRPPHIFVTQNGDWMVQARNWEFRHFDCEGLICTNPEYFDRHKNRFPSVLIPNGVNPALFFPGPGDRAEYGIPANVPVILMVSALIPSKRVIEGLTAASNIPNAFVIVAGDGELRGQVSASAEKLLPGRFRNVTLPREKMPGLYRCADVFLHMSQDEPSANSYIEALASGLPIVTHDRPVTRWTLEDQAILLDTGNLSAVASALTQALQLNTLQHVADRRQLVERRFAWSSIALQYADFFQQIAKIQDFEPQMNSAKH